MVNPDTGKLAFDAFLRYQDHDHDGLSVFMGEVDTCDKASTRLKKPRGVGSLHTGTIRDIEIEGTRLNVVQDRHDHGLIDNLPFTEANPALAERFATELMNAHRLCWSPIRKAGI